jgi:hypothetical protein
MPSSPRADDAYDETVPDAALPSPPRSNRQALWIGLILGGLLLLLTATLGLVLFFATHNGSSDAGGETAATTPSADGNAPSANPRDDVPSPPTDARREDSPLLPADTKPEPEPEPWLPPDEQAQVNKAIDRGVKWLKTHQAADGSWGPRVGLAALPALTLLECGVKADDIRIQKAAHHVRKAMPALNQTYDLALAILFLDRLGDPEDEKLIQSCALRLVAGQAPSGGWTYGCRTLNDTEEKDLLFVLRQTQPRDGLDLFVGGSDGSASPGFIAAGPRASLDKSLQGGASDDSKLLPEGGAPPLDKGLLDPKDYKKAIDRLPADLRNLPAVQSATGAYKMPPADGTDNSNTQFAILGLSAAHRHKLPLERALALIVQRFHTSQLPAGRWNYHYNNNPNDQGSPAMTGAGLLGLAVGMGLAADHMDPRGKPRQIKDASIEKGFTFLAESIGQPLGRNGPRPPRGDQLNYYFLWSVERCGVLYNRREIGGKNWYPWGVELLVDRQTPDGFWEAGNYPGSLAMADTCFALLFLKRANLAKDLTKKLEFFMEGKKLQTAP